MTIKSLRITMDDDHFEAEVDGTGLGCTVGHSSGGIRIRSEKVDMETWMARLLGVAQGRSGPQPGRPAGARDHRHRRQP